MNMYMYTRYYGSITVLSNEVETPTQTNTYPSFIFTGLRVEGRHYGPSQPSFPIASVARVLGGTFTLCACTCV